MRNQLTLQIGDRNYFLKFNIGTYNHVRALTGQDPFAYKAESESYEHVIAFTKTVFHAGLLSAGFVGTGEQVDQLFSELTGADLQLIVNMYTNPSDSKPSLNGEVSKDTQGVNLG